MQSLCLPILWYVFTVYPSVWLLSVYGIVLTLEQQGHELGELYIL